MILQIRSFIGVEEFSQLIAKGWCNAVTEALSDDILTEQEETALVELLEHFEISKDDSRVADMNNKAYKASLLRKIFEGKIPEEKDTAGIPFNLQKQETLVYRFFNVDYYKLKAITRYRGSSHGLSIRVAKGIYYRPGMFSAGGHQTEEELYQDTGELAITDKHIYFAGGTKRFRVKYSKIVAFEPLDNGIIIQRDSANAKPETFYSGDGWFIYNLTANLARMSD